MPQSEPGSAPAEIDVETKRRIKVLVVDDHHMVAEVLTSALREEPELDVVGMAHTVAEALGAARRFEPDVVLMDYRLPDGDGATATAQLRAIRPQTRVVILTAFADEGSLVSALEAGCSGFITKDKAFREVVSAVRAAHEGEALISQELLVRLLPKIQRRSLGLGSNLTARENEILRLLADGVSNASIAERLTLSLNTVRNHVQSIITKLGAHSKLEAVANAAKEGILP
ncbi:MAG: response regulator transcription factor [Actinomycetota bacterium]